MVMMASIGTGEAVSGVKSGSMITAAIFGVVAVILWFYTVRGVMLGVKIRSDGIVARGLGRTTLIPWEEMDRIEVEGLIDGAASLGGAITPVVYRQGPQDSEPRRIELNMLGGYVFWPRRPTRMERNANTLQESLSRWREQKNREPQ